MEFINQELRAETKNGREPGTYFYHLRDPRTQEIRYIGKTVSPSKRFCRHIGIAKYNQSQSNTSAWIRELLENNSLPEYCIIQFLPLSSPLKWEDEEVRLISEYRNKGCKLTNISRGGSLDCACNRLGSTWTQEQRIKFRNTRLGKKVNISQKERESRQVRAAQMRERRKTPIEQYDLSMNFLRRHSSLTDAAKSIGVYKATLLYNLNKNYKGFIWKQIKL